jgi:hypothetical protein
MSRKRRKRDVMALARVEHDEHEELARRQEKYNPLDDFADRVADRLDGRSTARWSGLAVGLGIVAVVGLAGVVVYLLVRKRDGKVAGVLGEMPAWNPMTAFPPINIYNQLPGTAVATVEKDKPTKNLPETVAQADVVNHDTTMRTVRLTPTQAFRVATAPSNNPWRVNVRTLGPPGSWAAFATDFARLRPGSPTADDVMVVPSGADIVIHLNPRQILYGMSNTDGVCASVVTSEHLPSAAPVLSVVR